MPPKYGKKYEKSAKSAKKSAKITFDTIARSDSGKQYNTFEHGIQNPYTKMVRKSSFGSSSKIQEGDPIIETDRQKSIFDFIANRSGEPVTSPRTMENTRKNETILDKASGIRRKTRKTKKSKGKNHKKTIRKNNKKKHTQKKY